MSDSTTGPLAQRVTPGATAADLGIHAGNWYHGAVGEELLFLLICELIN
jgi:hypothetical protein